MCVCAYLSPYLSVTCMYVHMFTSVSFHCTEMDASRDAEALLVVSSFRVLNVQYDRALRT